MTEADEAIEESRQALKEVQEQTAEATSLGDSFKEIRGRNHFAEQLEAIVFRHGGTLHDT